MSSTQSSVKPDPGYTSPEAGRGFAAITLHCPLCQYQYEATRVGAPKWCPNGYFGRRTQLVSGPRTGPFTIRAHGGEGL